VVQTDLAEKKEKKKKKLCKTGGIWRSFHVGCVNQRPQSMINKCTMKGKKNKNHSPRVEINSTVEQLREGLLDTGHSLQALLVRMDPKVLRRVSRILIKKGLHFANLFYIFE